MKFIYFCIPYSVVTFQESVTVFYLVSWIGDLCFVVRKAASLPRLAFIFFEHLETWVPFIWTVFFKNYVIKLLSIPYSVLNYFCINFIPI